MALSHSNHQPRTPGNKLARHYNLSSLSPSIVSDGSLNLEANLRKATETNLHPVEAPAPPSLFNGGASTLGDGTLVSTPRAPKHVPHQQTTTSNKRSREAVYTYNKVQPRPDPTDSINLQHFRLVPADPASVLDANTALSRSQQQLMELINFASKTRPAAIDFNSNASLPILNSFPSQSGADVATLSPHPHPPPPPPPPPPLVVTYMKTTTMAPPTHPPRPQSMPKRPTVFRQSPSPLVVANSGPQPPQRATTGPNHGPPRTTVPVDGSPEQKQRVRVLLSRIENPALNSNYKRINRPQLKRFNSSERPFPSVDSDPPTSTSTRAPIATTASSSARPYQTTTTTTTTTTPLPSTVVEVERDESGNNSTAEEEPEEEEGEEEASDTSDTPPPPGPRNFNATALAHPHEAPNTLAGNDARLVTDEEALLAHFGESTRLDTFSAPAALTSAAAVAPETDNEQAFISNFAEGASTFERRFLEQDSHSDPTSDDLSFADYLLPIVQQYHVLIIAILFNMWLEGLHIGEHEAPHRKLEDFGSKQHTSGPLVRPSDRRFLLGQPNLLSSGSDESRGHADLVAVPLRRSSLHPGLETVSKLDSGSLSAAPFRAGSSTRWQAYAVRKHLSQSMDSLRHPRELANQEDESSSGLSRHNSLRSSSSEQLLSTSGRNKMPQISSRSPLLKLASQQLQQQQQLATFPPPLAPNKGIEMSACSLFFGLITVCITLMVLVANQNYLSALAQCTIILASVLLCMVGLCLSNLSLPGELRRYHPEPRHVQSLHLIFVLAGYYYGLTLLLNLDKRQTPGQPLPAVLLQFIHRHLMPISNQVNQLFMFQLLLALKGFLLVLQVTLQTILNRVSLNQSMGHLRQVYTSLMFANLGLWALELRDQQQFLNQHHHYASSSAHTEPAGGVRELVASFSIPSLSVMNELSGTLVSLSHFYHALVFLQR